MFFLLSNWWSIDFGNRFPNVFKFGVPAREKLTRRQPDLEDRFKSSAPQTKSTTMVILGTVYA